jgi:hypothetical protein
MQAFIAALEVFSGGSDRVTSDQLVGLSEEHREVLAKKSGASFGPRTSDTQSQPDTARIIDLPPPAPLTVTTHRSGIPNPAASSGSTWIVVGLIAFALLAVALVALLR